MKKLVVAVTLLALAGVLLWWRARGEPQTEPGAASGVGRAGSPTSHDPPSAGDLEDEPGGGRRTDDRSAAPGKTPPLPSLDVELPARDRSTAPTPSVQTAVREADKLRARGEPLAALRALSRVWEAAGAEGRSDLRRRIDPLADELYFSRKPVPDIARFVEVRRGDTLAGIASRLKREEGLLVAPGLIMKVNGIRDPRRVQAGQSLKIPTEPLRIVVRKRTHELDVFLGDVPVLSYAVGLGKDDSTPVGRFVIATRQEEPIWFHDGERIPFGDSRNVLGTRWLGFANTAEHHGYGIHGTWEPETIGHDASEGCVRMRNEDVEELFGIIPRGVEVTIRP